MVSEKYDRPLRIEQLRPEHWEGVRGIYAQAISARSATFETSVPSWKEWDASHLAVGRLVARQGEEIVGWAAVSPVSDRCAYQGVAEVSVYVAQSHRGRGIGSRLLEQLIEESENLGIWTLQAGMFPENEASVALHKRLGFREVGIRKRLGKLEGAWRDVLLLERRSEVVGAD